MKKTIFFLMAALMFFVFCSCEKDLPAKDNSDIPTASEPEDIPETVPEETPENIPGEVPEEKPEEIPDVSHILGTAVKNIEIWNENESPSSDYVYELTDHFDRWKNLLFSPEISVLKAADAHDIVRYGEISLEDVEAVFRFLNGFEPGVFDENSELNPHTGGGLCFGAYTNSGDEIWKAVYNGGWLIIHLAGDEKSFVYNVEGQNTEWPAFEFLEPEPIVSNTISAFEKLCKIYYTEPENAVFDTADYPGEIDTEKFTRIYQTEYYYSDGSDYQMFKADIKNGKTFSELIVPTDRFFVSYLENGEVSTMELTYTDGVYVFGMRFPEDNGERFIMPETPELSDLAKKLDLRTTECRNVRLIGYADGILMTDGQSEYFYVLGVGANSIDDMKNGDLLSSAELAEKMFG